MNLDLNYKLTRIYLSLIIWTCFHFPCNNTKWIFNKTWSWQESNSIAEPEIHQSQNRIPSQVGFRTKVHCGTWIWLQKLHDSFNDVFISGISQKFSLLCAMEHFHSWQGRNLWFFHCAFIRCPFIGAASYLSWRWPLGTMSHSFCLSYLSP